jgi:hypothetical protein
VERGQKGFVDGTDSVFGFGDAADLLVPSRTYARYSDLTNHRIRGFPQARIIGTLGKS